MRNYSIIVLSAAALLSGCASVTTGNKQSVSVTTSPVSGAACKLSNDSGTWFVPTTPGSVTVERSLSDMNIVCEKEGYGTGTTTVASSTKGMAFGNIIAGGVIGAAVDVASGAAYDYPTEMHVPLTKEQSK
ncbi:MAG: hypothetical protein ACPGXY_05985 [Alphaproteobacteria bacterium]